MKKWVGLLLVLGTICGLAFDLRITRVDTNNVGVWVTNAPPCLRIEYSRDARQWEWSATLKSQDTDSITNFPVYMFIVPASKDKLFWRGVDCGL